MKGGPLVFVGRIGPKEYPLFQRLPGGSKYRIFSHKLPGGALRDTVP